MKNKKVKVEIEKELKDIIEVETPKGVKVEDLRRLKSGEVPKKSKIKNEIGYGLNEFDCPGILCPMGYWREPLIDFRDEELLIQLAKEYKFHDVEEFRESDHYFILLGSLEGIGHEVLTKHKKE